MKVLDKVANVHDESILFTLIYVSLAVILSMAISMFWLVVLVIIHGILEWKKIEANKDKLLLVLWHLKLDLTLVVFALWLGVYMDTIFGLLGLGHAARAGANLSSRFVAWQSATRGTLLSLDDAAQIVKAVVKEDKGKEMCDLTISPWRDKWKLSDKITIAALFLFVFLIIFAPQFIGLSYPEVFSIIKLDLHPFP